MEFKPPNEMNFAGYTVENWKSFKRRFMVYYDAAELSKKGKATQVAIFLHISGEAAQEIYHTLNVTEDQRKDLDAIIKAFDSYCLPKTNVCYERLKFNTCKQQPGQTFDE